MLYLKLLLLLLNLLLSLDSLIKALYLAFLFDALASLYETLYFSCLLPGMAFLILLFVKGFVLYFFLLLKSFVSLAAL